MCLSLSVISYSLELETFLFPSRGNCEHRRLRTPKAITARDRILENQNNSNIDRLAHVFSNKQLVNVGFYHCTLDLLITLILQRVVAAIFVYFEHWVEVWLSYQIGLESTSKMMKKLFRGIKLFLNVGVLMKWRFFLGHWPKHLSREKI